MVCALCGGPEGDRTLDLRVANAALSQLSHEPVCTVRPFREYPARQLSAVLSDERSGTILFYSFQYLLSRLLKEIAEKICSFFMISLPARSATVLETLSIRS